MNDQSILQVERRGAAMWVQFLSPPINVLTGALLMQLDMVTKEAELDDQIKVFILESGDPEFFAAHIDIALLEVAKKIEQLQTELSLFHRIVERIRTMPKVSIAKIRGRARGAGAELLLGFDMRIAGKRSVLAQPEILLGFPPGGGAITRLARIIGRTKALEVMLTGRDYCAEEAERIGWLTATLPEEYLDAYVDKLVRDLEQRPASAIRFTKQAFNEVEELPLEEGLKQEWYRFGEALRSAEAQRLCEIFKAHGGQTDAFERELSASFHAALQEHGAV